MSGEENPSHRYIVSKGERGMQPKSSFSVLFPAALALAGWGCTGAPTNGPAPRPHEGRVVRVACPGDPATAVVRRYRPPWAAPQRAEFPILRYSAPARAPAPP